jgi:preprotein translocase subunit SecG
MDNFLNIAQLSIAILLIISILLQHRGTSLGGAFGGETNVYRSRRGIEKFLFYLTFVLGVIFVSLAVINVLVKK